MASSVDGQTIKVIAGHLQTVDGQLDQFGAVFREHTESLFIDLKFTASASTLISVPAGHNAFVFVRQGELLTVNTEYAVPATRMAIVTDGEMSVYVPVPDVMPSWRLANR